MNTNLAYNLADFLPREQTKTKQNSSSLRIVKARRQAFTGAFSAPVACAFAVVVTLVSLIVYNQVCLNEIVGEINSISSELKIMESEHVRYTSLLESAISIRAVAQQAEDQLGMKKLDQYQTVYVNLYAEDQIIPSEGSDKGKIGSALAAVASAISTVKEYIAGN